MTRFLPVLAALSLLAAAAGCPATRPVPAGPDPDGPPWFQDVTAGSGLSFHHDPGPIDSHFFMPQIMGSGGAVIDLEGDGRFGLYLVHMGGPKGKKNQLFRHKGDGTFEDISPGSGLDVSGWCTGVAVGDLDDDGLPDVLLCEFGRVRLFRNLGGGKFQDATGGSGLVNPLWATSAAFVDYDRDGRLDLFVANYIAYEPGWPCSNPSGHRDYCSPAMFKGTAGKLYRNLGAGKFKDVSFESGVGRRPGPGLGVIAADFDGDGWPDIFVANDGAPNHLWMNQQDGTFKEEALARGVAVNAMGVAEANMGIAWGDIDGDGLEDLFVTHLRVETNTLWRQGPRGQFRDGTGASGMNRTRWKGTGFGAVLADFDNDGYLDAAVANGAITRQRGPDPGSGLGERLSQYSERNQMFVNDGKGGFRDVSPREGAYCGAANVGRGLITADLYGDGGLCLVVLPVGGPARLLRNVTPRGHWLGVRAVDPTRKRDAYGAEITVRAGGRTWVRTANPAGGYLTSGDPRVHVGLGPAAEAEWIEVRWPDGVRERFSGGPADQHRIVEKDTGKVRGGR